MDDVAKKAQEMLAEGQQAAAAGGGAAAAAAPEKKGVGLHLRAPEELGLGVGFRRQQPSMLQCILHGRSALLVSSI